MPKMSQKKGRFKGFCEFWGRGKNKDFCPEYTM